MTRYLRHAVQRKVEQAGSALAEALAEASGHSTPTDVPLMRMLTTASHEIDTAMQLLDEQPDPDLDCDTCGAPIAAQEAPETPGYDSCPDCGALHRQPPPPPPYQGPAEDDIAW